MMRTGPRPKSPSCGVFPSSRGGAGGELNPWSGCVPTGSLNFSTVFSDSMVLQMQPAQAAVYGYFSGSSAAAKVTVTVAADGGNGLAAHPYSVNAAVDAVNGTWKALLKPAAAGGSHTITATCASGCTGSVVLKKVTFGDVWCECCAASICRFARVSIALTIIT